MLQSTLASTGCMLWSRLLLGNWTGTYPSVVSGLNPSKGEQGVMRCSRG